MKSKYFNLVFSIAMSAIYLTSCTPSKISLKEQEKNGSPNIGIADLSKKLELKQSTTKSDTVSATKRPLQAESSVNDTTLSDLAKKLQDSKLDGLADSIVICTIKGDPITVGDYRRQFKSEQEQAEASLAVNPQMANNLIRMAQERGIALSLEEKKHLAGSANKMQAGGAKGFNKMLAENKMTKNQFQDQVFNVGLSFKMAGKLIEEGLLNELISRKLLSGAAKENGYSKEALNKYTEVAKSPQYKRLLQMSGISVDDLRDEIVTNELCLREIDQIKKESSITDIEISNYYEKNRGKFRHGPRIRLSQIFISKSNSGSETAISTRMRLKKENPKLSNSEISKQIADLEKKKEQLAKELLERARKGEDFALLANQYTEDLAGIQKKNGGDIGFQEESKLAKSFADKIMAVPVGGVVSELIVSPYGFHIFKVSARESKGFYSLSEIKDNLKELLAREKGQQVVESWLENARKKAEILISPEMENLIASNKLQKRAL